MRVRLASSCMRRALSPDQVSVPFCRLGSRRGWDPSTTGRLHANNRNDHAAAGRRLSEEVSASHLRLRLHHHAGRDQPGPDVSPKRYCDLPGESDDRNLLRRWRTRRCKGAIPFRQSAIGLETQPVPCELNEKRSRNLVPRFIYPNAFLDISAGPRRWCQPEIGSELFSVGEVTIIDFTGEQAGAVPTDAFDPFELKRFFGLGKAGVVFLNGLVSLSINLPDQFVDELDPSKDAPNLC